jgi:hypothetical protein
MKSSKSNLFASLSYRHRSRSQKGMFTPHSSSPRSSLTPEDDCVNRPLDRGTREPKRSQMALSNYLLFYSLWILKSNGALRLFDPSFEEVDTVWRIVSLTYSLSFGRFPSERPHLWSSSQSSWLQIHTSRFYSRRYKILWEVIGLERGPLSPVSKIEELLERESSGSGLENRDYGHRGSVPLTMRHPLSKKVGTR